jgi:hypothetical protein
VGTCASTTSLADGLRYSSTGDYTHIVGMDFFNQAGSGGLDVISGLQIYNNYFYSTQQGDTSAYIELTDGQDGCNPNSTLSSEIFNNVMVQDGTWHGGDGFIFEHGCFHTDQIYNNTIVNSSNTSGVCMSLNVTNTGTGTNYFTVKNNICVSTREMISNFIGTSPPTLTANNNIYYDAGDGWYWEGKTVSSLAQWQSVTGQDADASVGNPGLDSTYGITSASSLAYKFGANLTFLGNPLFDTGAPETFGPTGSCGSGCLARASAGAWSAGAYPYSSSSATPDATGPAPPTGLTAIAK